MQAVGAVQPEFNSLLAQGESVPERRPWNLSGMPLVEDPNALFQVRTTAKDATLLRDGRANLAGSRPAMEVPIYCRRVKFGYFSFHSHLPPQSLPVKAQGRPGVLCEFCSLSALRIGEKAKTSFPYTLRQDHAYARRAVARRGRQGGRVGIVGFGLLSLRQPGIKQRKRIFRSDVRRMLHIEILAAGSRGEGSAGATLKGSIVLVLRGWFLFGYRLLLALVFSLSPLAHAASRVQAASVPAEMLSTAFTVTVNGKPVDVAHAAASYEYVSFDITGPVDIEITAAEPHFWERGVDIQPWRLGLHAARSAASPQTIRFRLSAPAKLAISRPRDFLNHAEMLFLFASAPTPLPPGDPKVQVYSPGVYRQSLNPKSGDTLYLSPGSYFFGGLNLWKVDNVKILGRGTIVYDGPQDPGSDESWMQKPDWHCIEAFEAHHIEVDGLTCIVRSRTWSIQMKDSSGVVYDDLRVMGGNPGNANQDGMDWIGSSDGVVRNSFFRASDDVIALMGNWDGYTDEDMLRPGKDVQNIVVENSVLSTSISNIVRAGWPRKIFNSRNFTLRDSDILHAGIGACGQTFGILGFWGANGSRGDHGHYTFENLFLDDWYSLLQMEQDAPALHDFTFRNIWALDQPPLSGSLLSGSVSGVVFENVKYGQKAVSSEADLPLVNDRAQPARFDVTSGPVAIFTVDPPVFGPNETVTFTAQVSPHTRFTWLFGDGSEAHGRIVKHKFTDADGTQLDGANGAGRFRVVLHVHDDRGGDDWAAQGVVAVAHWHDAVPTPGPMLPGLAFQIYPGAWTELPDFSAEKVVIEGDSPSLNASAQGFTKYATTWDGFIDIPADGGYTFHLMDRDGARLVIDGIEVTKTGPPFAQVCGAPGNAMRYDRGSIGLRAGHHTFHMEGLHSASQGPPRLMWEGPGLPITDVPDAAFSRQRMDTLRGN